MAVVFLPIAPRPAPVKTEGLVPWVRANLFGDWKSSIATLAILAIGGLVYYLGKRAQQGDGGFGNDGGFGRGRT